MHKCDDDDLPAPKCDDSGDIGWMCLSTLLVLTMLPALALFEAGMIRTKSTLSIISQVFAGLSILSTMWFTFGYSLTFGTSHSHFIGDFDHVLLINVSPKGCSKHAQHIPELLFAMFQSMFATIAPLLITGAFAERMRFSVVVAFLVLWEVLIYYPTAQAIWNVDGWLKRFGTLDFAGGLVLHTPAGVSSLVCSIFIGRRCDFDKHKGQYLPSNLPLATIGCALLWAGWFGFNGGSAFQANHVAVSAISATQVSACVSGCCWLVLSWWYGKPSVVAVLNGAIAGLAGITPGSGYVSCPAAMLIGFIVGVASYYAAQAVLRLRIDDALSVFACHGVTGMIGSVALGVAADPDINCHRNRGGAAFGHWDLLGKQVAALVFVVAYTAAMTTIILYFLKYCFRGGLRISPGDEEVGLDWTDHGEVAYHNLVVKKPDGLRRRKTRYQHSGSVRGISLAPPVITGQASLQAPLIEEGDAESSGSDEDGPPQWDMTPTTL